VIEPTHQPIGDIVPKLVLAVSLLAALIVAACGSAAPAPSGAVVSPPPASFSPSAPAPEGTPTAPVATPVPTVQPTAAPTAKPTAVPTPRPAYSRAERYLLEGMMRGEGDCSPVRSGLPGRAIAGIDCDLVGSPVARMGFYLFRNETDLLKVYLARMKAEGIGIETGGCIDGEGESSYIPWAGDDLSPYRQGCFINDLGYANYRATLPGSQVYVGLLGRTADLRALEDWAWIGNEDVPGSPTLWQQDVPYRP
jgi:hypothetical protein